MNDYLKSYRACINVHSPMYIGSGREYTKKEYIIQNDTVYIVDFQKLSTAIHRKGLFDSFSNFMTGQNKNLHSWLMQNGFSTGEINSIIDYSFSGNNVDLSKQYGIRSCIKDAFNRPYIPGSTVKGYIRTALLAYEINNHPEDYSKFKSFPDSRYSKNYKKELNKTADEIEKAAFEIPINNKDSKSKMSGIIISDSEPLSSDNLVLCEKIDLFPVNKSGDRQSMLNTYFEAIKPGTKVWFTITIDSTKCNYTKDDIMAAIKLFAAQYKESYLCKFEMEPFRYTNTIWLGGNTGYPTKTITYNLLGKDEGFYEVCDIMEFFFRDKNKSDRKFGISPHCLKVTKYNGQLCRMGEGTFAFAKTDSQNT